MGRPNKTQSQMAATEAYRWHRLALTCADPFEPQGSFARALAELTPQERSAFTDFLVWHKLAPLWHQRLEAADLHNSVWVDMVERLRSYRRAASALYLVQRHELMEIDKLFERHAIPYVAIKGVSVRETVYGDASLRPATDIDVLVDPARRLEAGAVLIKEGFKFLPDPKDIGREATFVRGPVAIDLHWNILRTGRTRRDVVAGLLERRSRHDIHWGLDPSDILVLMLIHPAFTKYVTSSNMALISVVDFIFLLRSYDVDLKTVFRRLDRMGLRTAAWTVLTWFRMIAPPRSLTVTNDFHDQLKPGPMRRLYLQSWLTHDLATRLLDRPFLIQSGLTLALHDRPTDAVGAIRGLLSARVTSSKDPMLSLGSDDEALKAK